MREIIGIAIILASITIVTVLETSPQEAFGTFPGTNGKIAFDRGNASQIFVMNADGSGQTNLSNNANIDTNPSWSPDGTKIAFTSDGTGGIQIFVMNADGSGQTNLSNNGNIDITPSWSPDGTKIAFSRLTVSGNHIFVMNADGSGQTDIDNNGNSDYYPSWSPDGTKIAFHGLSILSLGQIFVMNADGTGRTNLSNNAFSDNNPSWSPDGTKIAFTSDRTGVGQIFVMNADGSGQTDIDNNGNIDLYSNWGSYPNPIKTTISLSSSANPSVSGQSVTFTATVNPAVPDFETVTFYDGPTLIGTGTTTGSVAKFTTSLTAGSYSITATYSGDSNFSPSTNNPGYTQTVLTPTQATTNLINTINNLGLPNGVATNLLATLKNIDLTNIHSACGKLDAFLNKVNTDLASGQLNSLQANQLIQEASAIKTSIGC